MTSMKTSVSDPPIWKPKLPPSTRMEPGAVHPTPPERRQLTNPLPYLAPTMNAPFFRPGTITMHCARLRRSCGIDLSGMPMTSLKDSAAACNRSGASAADRKLAPRIAAAIKRIGLNFIRFLHFKKDVVLSKHHRTGCEAIPYSLQSNLRRLRTILSSQRNGPQVKLLAEVAIIARIHRKLFFRLPIAHIERVRDDAGADSQLIQQLGAEPRVHAGQQKQRDDSRLADIRFEQIVFLEADQVFHTRFLGVFIGLADALRIDIDSHAARAIELGRGDHDPAVAASQIVNDVFIRDLGQFQHGFHAGLGGGQVGNLRRLPRWRSSRLGGRGRYSQEYACQRDPYGSESKSHGGPPVHLPHPTYSKPRFHPIDNPIVHNSSEGASVTLAGFFGWPTRLNGAGPRNPTRAARKAIALCRNLLSERGEVSGTLLASEALAAYQSLDEISRTGFFDLLAEEFSPDPERVGRAGDAYRTNPSPENLLRLQAAVESPREELFRRLNLAPGGTRVLVELRGRLLRKMDQNPQWEPVVADLERLLTAWFNRGFLELRRIDWRTSAIVLEKLIRYEAVHEIQGWNDLRRRLEADRRCYAFFHPALPEEPIIFIEAALTRGMTEKVQPLLDPDSPVMSPASADSAMFYSITNCQEGLRGVPFGSFLIKRVVEDLGR